MPMFDILSDQAIGRSAAATSVQAQQPVQNPLCLSGRWKRAWSRGWSGNTITKGAAGREARQGEWSSKGGGAH